MVELFQNRGEDMNFKEMLLAFIDCYEASRMIDKCGFAATSEDIKKAQDEIAKEIRVVLAEVLLDEVK